MIDLINYLENKGWIFKVRGNLLFIYQSKDDLEWEQPLHVENVNVYDRDFLLNAVSNSFKAIINSEVLDSSLDHILLWNKKSVDFLIENGYTFQKGFYSKYSDSAGIKSVIIPQKNGYKSEEYSTDYDEHDNPYETFDKSFWDKLEDAII